MSRNSSLACALGLAFTFLNLPLRAADDDDRSCSVASLKGTYGLSANGIRPVPPTIQMETHATIALRSHDGKGGVKSTPLFRTER